MHKNFTTFFLGTLSGVFLIMSLLFLYRTVWIRDFISKPIVVEKMDSSKNGLLTTIYQIKSANLNFEEKFSSVNKRLDDFLFLGGVIITLLLAVTVSVYLKTETEVHKHFIENFEKYEQKVVKATNDVENASRKILAMEQLFTAKAKKMEENAPI